MFYLNQWKDAFKSESFTAKNIRTDRQTEVLPVGKKHYAVILHFSCTDYALTMHQAISGMVEANRQ